ncbi:hypothetical protein PCANC_16950 [Puccinia coronata f. sp. avenae]|uniref:Uncharacterized protein n=1 Tax=Puccinia coronata f. sp. avenae TaxID=200324 RepID=A0A2N5V5K7_9BASI|nr:hypothetical protein PCANC_16950 [Puccinia coronata f. sp. avenae]
MAGHSCYSILSFGPSLGSFRLNLPPVLDEEFFRESTLYSTLAPPTTATPAPQPTCELTGNFFLLLVIDAAPTLLSHPSNHSIFQELLDMKFDHLDPQADLDAHFRRLEKAASKT